MAGQRQCMRCCFRAVVVVIRFFCNAIWALRALCKRRAMAKTRAQVRCCTLPTATSLCHTGPTADAVTSTRLEASHGFTAEETCEFSISVETELDPAWCIGGDPSSSSASSWMAGCQTSTIVRQWDDFERLPKAKKPWGKRPVIGMTVGEAATILGLPSSLGDSFTIESLKVAYKAAALRFHPDKGGTDQAFNDVHKAYDVLSGHVV